MKLVTLKSILWFSVIFLLALSFPVQVMYSSPLPALFPYIVISLIVFLTPLSPIGRYTGFFWQGANTRMNLILGAYLFLVLFQTGWQSVLGFISVEQSLSVIVIYILPMVFFIYFTRVATDQEIRSVLLAIAWAGLVVGLYFVYDSYMMMVVGQVNDFSLRAYEYSQFRGGTADINPARISANARSHGALENHSISAAWISLGCFAVLTLVPRHQTWWRMIIVATYGLMLMIGLNFTGIVGFALVIFLMEFGDIAQLRRRMSKQSLNTKVIGSGLLILIGISFVWSIGDRVFELIQKNLAYQIDLAIGTEKLGEADGQYTYFDGLMSSLLSFPHNMLNNFPFGLLVGDGFSNGFGVIAKGGDYGIAETLHRFGLPFFIVIVASLIKLILRALKQMRASGTSRIPQSSYLWFAVCVIIYLSFTEIHYTVWNAKSILPIFFFVLALYARCLMPRHYSTKNSIVPKRIRST